MTIEDFEVLARKRFDYCLDLMVGQKHKEYSRNDDKLYNFKRSGEILRCSSERALIGMWIKQVVSLIDIVEDIEGGCIPTPYFYELLNEKTTDVINYPVLLEGLLNERR